MSQLVVTMKGTGIAWTIVMRIRILGANGGIGNGANTTALLVDTDILLDAGTGVASLTLEEMASIDHVFLTHAHLDHVVCIPFLLDSVGSHRQHPLVVHAEPATLDVLRRHVFNNFLWPDFTRIPTPENPWVRMEPILAGATVTVQGRSFRSIPVNHTVPAVGYLIGNGRGSFGFSGDTAETQEYWKVLSACPDLKQLVIETSFMDEEEALSTLSGHLCPRLVAQELEKYTGTAPVYITHLMPGEEEQIMTEIRARMPHRPVQVLRAGMVFDL